MSLFPAVSISRRRVLALMAGAPMLLSAQAARGQVQAQAWDEPPEMAADRIFGTWLEQQGAPGGVLGVVRAGQLVVKRGYGVRGLDDPATPDADTLYCIASVTKAITAFGILLLCDEGRLQLDAPARRFLNGSICEYIGLIFSYPASIVVPNTAPKKRRFSSTLRSG